MQMRHSISVQTKYTVGSIIDGIKMQYLSNVKSNHTHQFDEGNPLAQKKILIATILTGVMMVFEILEVGSLIRWLYLQMAGT